MALLRSKQVAVLFLFYFFTLARSATTNDESIENNDSVLRGVSKESYEELYKPIEIEGELKWRCLNNPEILISYDQLNDNYCDCPDGSDEPGTSACSDIKMKNGNSVHFFCKNEGFFSYHLDSSKVDDDVCDCCDCSDELDKSSQSSFNTCQTMKREYDDLVNQELGKYEKGSKILQQILNQTELHQNKDKYFTIKTELEDVDQQISDLESIVSQLHVEMNSFNPVSINQKKSDTTELDAITMKFEAINISKNIIDPLNKYFGLLGETFKYYTELNDIVENLEQDYNMYLNDPVVNENMELYMDLKDDLKKTDDGLIISTNFDLEQLEQLVYFYNYELYQIFVNKNAHLDNIKSYKHLLGKFSMAQAIIAIKNRNYNTVIDTVQDTLIPIMEKIVNGNNGNDEAVIESLTKYKAFVAENGHKPPHADKLLKIDPLYEQNIQFLQSMIINEGSKIFEKAEKETGGKTGTSGVFFLGNIYYNNLLDNSLVDVLHIKNLFYYAQNKVFAYKRNKIVLILDSHQDQLTELKDLQSKMNEQMDFYYQFIDKTESEYDAVLSALRYIGAQSNNCIPGSLDKYDYQICLGTPFVSRNNRPQLIQQGSEGTYNLGLMSEFSFDHHRVVQKYDENLFKANVIGNLSSYFINKSILEDSPELSDIHNGLLLKYTNGDKCWKGPKRSTSVYFYCAHDFKILRMSELSRCTYEIEIEGPLGCTIPQT